MTTVVSSPGRTRRYVIDARMHVVSETDGNDATTYFERDRFNRLVRRTDPLGRTTGIEYDEHGRVASVTRPDGRGTTVEYDELGLPVLVTRPDGSRIRREYGERGNLTAVTGPSGTTRFTYDALGHPASVTDPAGRTTLVRCNAAGLAVESVAPSGGVTRHTYDALGRPSSITDPLGRVTRLTWSVEGRLLRRTDPEGGEHTWSYDGEGNVLTHTAPDGGRSVYEYGAFDRLVARTGPDSARYEFDHDTELRLRRVTDPRGLTWTYDYDPGGRLVSGTDFDGRTLRYGYDAAGQLTARTNAAGQTVTYAYTAIGQFARKEADGAATTYEYDTFDELVRVIGPDATPTRLRDRSGLLRSETVNGRTLAFGYDALGRTTRRTTPTGAVSEWDYDRPGNATRLTASGRTVTFHHDGMGRERSRTFGSAATLSYGRDGPGRQVEQLLTGPDGHTMWRRGHHYRPDGHLTAVETDHGRRDFTLDVVGRVTAVTASGWEERCAYDESGNQAEAQWPDFHSGAGVATGHRVYERNRFVPAGGLRYEYDAQGRVTLRQKARLSRKPDTWRFAWDAEGRLVGLTTPDGTVWRYVYDPLRRRIAKQRLSADGEVAEEVTFTWEGSALCEQTSVFQGGAGSVTLTRDYRDLHPVAQTGRLLSASQEEVDSRFFSIVTDLVGGAHRTRRRAGCRRLADPRDRVGSHHLEPRRDRLHAAAFPGAVLRPRAGAALQRLPYLRPRERPVPDARPAGLAPAPNPAAYVHNPLTWSDRLGLAPDECTVTVYRKQTRHPLSQRVHVDENGNVTISGNNQLYVNMSGDIKHTVEFRGDGGRIVSFEVPKSFVEDVRRHAVPQDQPDGLGFIKQEWKQVKKYYPEISDPTKGPDLYGLPGEVIEKMRRVIIPGPGKMIQDYG
ncbi:type IV secretion protein Rhs [Streptomyces minutiscleroticus]|uniref:Type IV secretion protein Rhs n=1 Tax=Streptomyces minutiscleroticus TaxID=68238 RepID=A0A918P120_9ACTN|nr:RHS repeat protein [Streptomyces minutiscleroticus]GGY12438.1 type IV secretion protein Rhs [Streptomyces minutiscleroticus]